MSAINMFCLAVIFRVKNAVYGFMHDEKGDTNFVSMAIIIAIVIVIAGLFLTLGQGVMKTITQGIKNFFTDKAKMTWQDAE